MTISSVKRITGATLVAALAVSGASLSIATSASADTVNVVSFGADDSTYFGWHNQLPALASSAWDGVHLGDDGYTYVVNGYVNSGEAGLATTAIGLKQLILDTSVQVGAGSVNFQVPFSVPLADSPTPGSPPSGQWGTLASSAGATPSDGTFSGTDLFISSKTITGTTIVAYQPQTLNALIAQLALLEPTQTVRFSGVGLYATVPSVVESLTVASSTWDFTVHQAAIAQSSTASVLSTDIRPDNTTYTGWHETRDNLHPAWLVTKDGLTVGDLGSSEIVNGITPIVDPDLYALLGSITVTTTGEVSTAVDIDFGDGQQGTLRPVQGYFNDVSSKSLFTSWTFDADIAATATTEAYTAGDAWRLGDFAEALTATGDVAVTGFGIAGSPAHSGTVSGILFNGVKYSFAPVPSFADATDVNSPFYIYVEWAKSSGITTGTPQSSGNPLFRPLDAVSRQAFASFLYKQSNDSFTAPTEATFADVPVGSQFFTAIEWMAAAGISTGTPQATGKPLFKPADAVSRSATALFLTRYLEADLPTVTEATFADVPTSSSIAPAVQWLYAAGITTGTPGATDGDLPTYAPASSVSRQAMMAFLYRVAHLPVTIT